MKIALNLIQPSPSPIRTTWDEDKLNELADSVRERGLIVPIKVRPIDDQFEIVYGHRRAEASRRAGLTDVEAIIEESDDTDTLIQALIENLQREDMSPMDTARGLKALKDTTGWSNMDIERHGIMSNQNASKLLLVLRESPEIQQLLKTSPTEWEGISVSHVTETASVLQNNTDKLAVLKKAHDEALTTSQTRRIAEAVAQAPSQAAKDRLIEWDYSPTIHNPVLIKERAAQFGAHDPMYRDRAPSPAVAWQSAPEVIGVIDTMKGWIQALTAFRQTADVGKMSPEARRFVARRVREFVESLSEWADSLEDGE